jgi:cysteine desulfurase
LAVGFGEAARLAASEGLLDSGRLRQHRQRLLDALSAAIPGLRVNGSMEHRVSGNLNLSFPGVSAQALLAALPGLCLSTGSACSSAELTPSYVLSAMGLPEAEARCTLRIGLGRFTSPAEVDQAAAQIGAAWAALATTQHAPTSVVAE